MNTKDANERESYFCAVCGQVLTADEQRHTAPRCAPCEEDRIARQPDGGDQ